MNPIKNIEIKNFKSIRDLKIEDCRRINVFVGYPNTGKSNLLEAIGLYSSIRFFGNDFKFNDICRVKRFSELFFNKDYRNSAQVLINNEVELELTQSESNDLNVKLIINQRGIFWAVIGNDYRYQSRQGLEDITYLNKLSLINKYDFKANTLLNRRGPLSLSVPFGSNLLDVLHSNSALRKEITSLFEDYNQKLVIDDDEILVLKYLNDDTVVNIPYHLIADTLRRLIFYKAAILTNSDNILLFEEPEAHMFPPYVRKFTSDVIFDKTNQFFIATHSPYVLDAFMEEIPEDLSIFLVYYEDGETKVKHMSEKDMNEVRQFGVDLFYNLESYLKQHGQVNNA